MSACSTCTRVPSRDNASMADDSRPVEEGCACPACSRHSRAYLRHLIMAGEILGMVLCTLHNLHFYQELMRRVRSAIEEDRFEAWAQAALPGLRAKRAE